MFPKVRIKNDVKPGLSNFLIMAYERRYMNNNAEGL